ncbi:26112_t:CDS:2, partial [Racocetra persica]
GKKFVLQCELLKNDNLVMITEIGVIVWAIISKEIRMHYYWGDWNKKSNTFESMKEYFNNKMFTGIIFPDSSFKVLYDNLDLEFGYKERKKFFRELLSDNAKMTFYLTRHGKNLMNNLIDLNHNLYHNLVIRCIINGCLASWERKMINISILSIIFEHFPTLSKRHASAVASFLAAIAYTVPSTSSDKNPSTSSHLSSYGTSYHLSKTSLCDILFSNFHKLHYNSISKLVKNLEYHNSNTMYNTIKLDFWNPKGSNFTSLTNLDYINRFIILAFAHSFHLLLRPTLDTSDPNNPWILTTAYKFIYSNGTIDESVSIIKPPDDNTNMFTKLTTAILAVYMIIAAHENKLRELMRKIQNGEWTGYKPPHFDKNLLEVILLRNNKNEEQYETLNDLSNKVENLEKNLSSKVENLEKSLSNKVENLEKNLSSKVENLEKNNNQAKL